jgi:signal transduction histidine kinase
MGAILLAAAALAGAAAMELLRGRRLAGRLQQVALSSHELRGALTAMGLALSRLERAPNVADRSRLEALRHGYERAVCVARDLEAARGAGPPPPVPRPEAVELREVARRVVETWSGAHPQVLLDWRAGPAVVHGYPMRLTQALDNLVANAVEHGHGPVTITGRMAGRFVSICVLDRGAGPMRRLDDLRPPPWHASRGHGLVVVRHAVELHGGTLRPVRGPLGAGIEVRLPVGGEANAVRAAGVNMPGRSGSGNVVAP